MTIASAMSSMVSCAGVPVRSMIVLFWTIAICGLNSMMLNLARSRMMCCICLIDMHMEEQVMTSLTKCAALKERVGDWDWADMMVLYCRNAADEDSEFARRMGVLLEEKEAAYNERVYFIKELELCRVSMRRKEDRDKSFTLKACRFFLWEITKDLRVAREINALCARVTAIVDQREMFVDELDMLAGRHVPDKMADFMKQVQVEPIANIVPVPMILMSSSTNSPAPFFCGRGESDMKDMFFTEDVYYFNGELSVSFDVPSVAMALQLYLFLWLFIIVHAITHRRSDGSWLGVFCFQNIPDAYFQFLFSRTLVIMASHVKHTPYNRGCTCVERDCVDIHGYYNFEILNCAYAVHPAIILVSLHKPPDKLTLRNNIIGDPTFSSKSWGGNPRNVMVVKYLVGDVLWTHDCFFLKRACSWCLEREAVLIFFFTFPILPSPMSKSHLAKFLKACVPRCNGSNDQFFFSGAFFSGNVWRKSPPNTFIFPPNKTFGASIRSRDAMPEGATAKIIFPLDRIDSSNAMSYLCRLLADLKLVGNKMHKAFPLPVMELPLPEEVPTASEENPGDVATTGSASDGTGKKKRRTLTLTTDDIQKRKSYWKITRLGGSSASYQFFVDMLKHLEREDLNQLWRLVKESLSIRPATSDKEMELWVELKRLYEPDVEDQLWTHTHNIMHAPDEWKLYDSYEVHHVTFNDKEIFMLVEKDCHSEKDWQL
uniref:Leucine-rich repeat protein n=1 Tax=Tanacetum cinerariifolium TaxID=118510 RepID=A0A6L2MFP9_TANCI|nr:leucine-rich repeat protein [Tanacetum cinerariifolium]